MNIGSFLIPDAQSSKLIEPSKAPLHDPAPLAHSASMFGVALGVAGTETSPDRFGVITAIA